MNKIKEYLLVTVGTLLTAIALEYFFFPNDSIVEKKQQIPKYKQLVSDYKAACNNSEKYALELTDIRKQISLKMESEQTILTEPTNTGAENMKEQDVVDSNKLLQKGVSSMDIFKDATANVVEKAQSSFNCPEK